jgi:hypothetical protein
MTPRLPTLALVALVASAPTLASAAPPPTADADRLAAADHAQALWAASCPSATDGLCVILARDTPPTGCHDGPRLRATARTAPAAATRALAAVVATFDRAPSPTSAVRHAYAMAKLRLADAALEAMLAVPLPHGLDFSAGAVKQASMRRFGRFFDTVRNLGTAASERYRAVLDVHDADATIAATARLGQLSATLAATMRAVELPVELRSGELAKDAAAFYCAKLDEVATPLVAEARAVLTTCVAKAAELHLTDAWAQLCQRELSGLPAAAPTP